MRAYETIEVEVAGEVVTVTLNRPKLNLFNMKMMEELVDLWHSLRTEREIRFVILTGKGDHFSAGADLRELSEALPGPEDARTQQLLGHELMRSLESVEQVTVAALKGVVCGAGMAVAQACDFRIMTEESYFIVPETNVGTYYTWGCTPRLVRLVGASKAMEIVMTCDPVPASEAYRLHLANKVVPKDRLMEETHAFILYRQDRLQEPDLRPDHQEDRPGGLHGGFREPVRLRTGADAGGGLHGGDPGGDPGVPGEEETQVQGLGPAARWTRRR